MEANGRENLYRCTKCQNTFTTKGDHVLHMRSHTKKKLFKCAVCEKTFTKTYLGIHMRIHTGERPYICAVCDKSFTQKNALDYHMRTHTGEKPFKCAVCEKSFARKDVLVFHTSTHTGEKPFKCDVCEKSFARKDKLVIHMRTHTREKPSKSAVCKKSFVTKSMLKRHMRNHTGEKPFKCTVCEKLFARKCHLNNHMRTHTGKKSYRRIACESFVKCKENSLHQNERIHCERNDEAFFHSSVSGKGEIPPKTSATASLLSIETSKLNCSNNTEVSQAKSLKLTGPEIMKEEFDSFSIQDTDYTEAVEETQDIASIDSVVDEYQILCLECGEKFRNADDYKRHSCYTDRLCKKATNNNEDVHEDNVSIVELDDVIHGTGSTSMDNHKTLQMDNLNHDKRYVESSSQDLDVDGVTQGNPSAIPNPKFLTNCKNSHPTRRLHCNNCERCKNTIYAYYEYLVVTDWLSQS